MDFLSLGLDINSFSPDKLSTLESYISAFTTLEKFNGKTINPVFGPGLAEFNASLASTSTLLADLNTKLAAFNTTNVSATNSKQQNTKATKELTVAEAALKLQIAEEDRVIKEYVKSKNALYQARMAEIKAIADEKKAKQAQAEQDRKDAAQQRRDAAQATRDAREVARAKKEAAVASREKAKADLDESKAIENLSNKYIQLKELQAEQIAAAQKSVANTGASSAESKQALKDLELTSARLNAINKEVSGATGETNKFGKALGGAFGQLRTLAYILPGIGIAGIFNLAFEAIADVVKEMGLFDDKSVEILNRQAKINQSLLEEFNILKSINEQRQKVFEVANQTSSANAKALVDRYESTGLNKVSLSGYNVFNAQTEFNEAKNKVGVDVQRDPVAAAKQIDQTIKQQQELSKKITLLESFINTNKDLSTLQNGYRILLNLPDFKEITKADLEKQKSILELDKASNEERLANLSNFVNKGNELEKLKAENQKLLNDEVRKRIINNAKEDIAVNEQKNDAILNSDISSEQKKINALSSLRKEKIELSNLDLYNVVGNQKLGIPKNPNATPEDINIAFKKNADETLIINAEFDKKIKDQTEQYRQQRIKAQSEIDQVEVNINAQRDEKIKNNEENSLQERIEALVRYIAERQKLQDIQLKTELDQNKYKTGDATSQKLIEEQQQKALEQKANIQADVEKSVYDIVYQSTQKQLKLIQAENKIDIENNKEKYGLEVRALTDSYREKKISYSKYKADLKKIDDQYQRESLDKTIEQDKIAVDRLQKNVQKNAINLGNARVDVGVKQQDLINAKESGEDTLPKQEDYDKAVGLEKGYLTAVQNGELSLSEAIQKQKDDEFKRNNLRSEEDLKKRRQYFQAIKQIEEALYKTIKEVGDRNYELKSKQIEEEHDARERQVESEIAAIDKSSLTAKDKAALDIQLNAKKREDDERTAKEQRKIAHDKAIFDRDIGMAHILVSTEEAVAALLVTPPLAIAAGIAGAAEFYAASTVNIPSYATGTDDHPGGTARFGEAGMEIVKEPYKSPYLVKNETVGFLPAHTKVIPIKDIPEFGGSVVQDDSWQQMYWLAKKIKQAMPSQSVNVVVNFNKDSYKDRILGR